MYAFWQENGCIEKIFMHLKLTRESPGSSLEVNKLENRIQLVTKLGAFAAEVAPPRPPWAESPGSPLEDPVSAAPHQDPPPPSQLQEIRRM